MKYYVYNELGDQMGPALHTEAEALAWIEQLEKYFTDFFWIKEEK